MADVEKRIVGSTADLKEMCEFLASRKSFSVDTETTGLRKKTDHIVGLSVCGKERGVYRSWYVPLAHTKERNAPLPLVRKHFDPILANEAKTWFFNYKFDGHFMEKASFSPAGNWEDVHPLAWLTDENAKPHGLKSQAKRHLGMDEMREFKELATMEEDLRKAEWLAAYEAEHGDCYRREEVLHYKCPICKREKIKPVCVPCGRDDLTLLPGTTTRYKTKKYKASPEIEPVNTIADVRLAIAGPYACDDAIATYRLAEKLYPKLQADQPCQFNAYIRVEKPVIPAVAWIEDKGIAVDSPFFEILHEEAHKERDRLAGEIYTIIGREINLGSHDQKAKVFFEEMKLPDVNGGSIDKYTLREWDRQEIPIAGLMLSWGEWEKLDTAFLDPMPLYIVDGRLYTSFNPFATRTGRWSSSGPNMQQATNKHRFRYGFIAPPGRTLVVADFKQMELVMAAHYSGDKVLTETLRNGEDLHKRTVSVFLGKSETEVTPTERKLGKVANFALIFRQSKPGFYYFLRANNMILDPDPKKFRAMSDLYYDRYFALYKGVRPWHNRQIRLAERYRGVQTITGRFRHLPHVASTDKKYQEKAYKQAINTPVQGSCADLVKIGLADQFRRWKETRNWCLLQVHDELVCEVDAGQEKAAEAVLRDCYEHVFPELSVPMRLDIHSGQSWGFCKDAG